VVLFAFIALILLLLVESGPLSHRDPLGQSEHWLSESSKNLLVFSLSSLLLGAAIGGLWVLPIWETVRIEPPFALTYFHNYEAGAAAVIAALGCIAAVRGRPVADWLIFLTAATTGTTLAIVSLEPVNDFFSTFLGWLLAEAVVTLAIAFFPEVVRVFRSFWGFDKTARGQSLFLSRNERLDETASESRTAKTPSVPGAAPSEQLDETRHA
jgi:hypothetical protein